MVGWGRPVRECPEGQTAYIGFTRDQICNNYGSPQRVLAKKKKKKSWLWHWFQRKPYLLQAFALFQESARLPAVRLTLKAAPGLQPLHHCGGGCVGGEGIDFQRLWRRLHLYHFLWNRSYFLSQLCIIFIIAYWSKPGPLSKQRGNCSSSLWVSFPAEGTGFAVPVLREPLCVYQPASPHASFPAHTPVNHTQTREMRKQWLWSEDVERAELVVPDYSGHSSSVSAIPLLIKNYPYFYRVDSCMLFIWTALWHLRFKF